MSPISETTMPTSELGTSNELKTIGQRKFMANGNSRYMLPSDDTEIGRLDAQHYVMRELIHGNFQSPIEELLESGIRVLDLGCASGIWCIEMAKEFPNSTFVGTDVAAHFPTDPAQIPKNCSFSKANTLQLPFEDNSFDFVYQRFMGLAFSADDWKIALHQIIRVLKPGGWVEISEGDFTMNRPPKSYAKFHQAFTAASSARGVNIDLVKVVKDAFESTDAFTKVTIDYIHVPMGWDGRVGDLVINNFDGAMTALGMLVVPFMDIDIKEYEKLKKEILEGFRVQKSWFKAPYGFGMKKFCN